ncbi:galactose-3-O-sulfotransferase 2-like [Rhinoraja longicauda]
MDRDGLTYTRTYLSNSSSPLTSTSSPPWSYHPMVSTSELPPVVSSSELPPVVVTSDLSPVVSSSELPPWSPALSSPPVVVTSDLPPVEKVMAKGTFYFSILRNPVTLMESSFTYYKGSSLAFKKVESLEQFLSQPSRYFSPKERGSHYARNLRWFDFGFDHNANDSAPYVDLVLEEIGATFQLVLVAEYFDESMVLLKEALCWGLDDVVSFKLNLRSNASVRPLSERAAGQIRAWNALDWKLYAHFNRTFWRKVELYGRQRMAADVLALREKRQALMELCLQGSSPVDASQIQDRNIRPFQYGRARIMGYNLNPNLDGGTRERCLRLVMPELQYKDLLDAKHFPSAPSSKVLLHV